jgi:hypothetical protein
MKILVGKVISFYNFTFTISHVFSDLPQNSSVHFDVLFSDKIREKINPEYKVAWWNGGMLTYVMLQDGYSEDSFNRHLLEIPSRYYPDFLKGRSTYFTAPFYKSHFNTSINRTTCCLLYIYNSAGMHFVHYSSYCLCKLYKPYPCACI